MVPDSGSLMDSTYFTWSVWVKINNLADHEVVLGKLLTSTTTGRELLLWESGAVTFYLANGSTACHYTTGAGAINAGTWIHIAGKWAADEKLTLFINGTSYETTCSGFSGVPDTTNALYIATKISLRCPGTSMAKSMKYVSITVRYQMMKLQRWLPVIIRMG
jgi:hypothetical protein